MPDTTKPETQRAVITYRTKPLEAKAKWSSWFQRVIDATDSQDAMRQFYNPPIWPAMTGMIEVDGITWPDGN